MKFITKIVVLFIASAGGLIAAELLIEGFSVTHDPLRFVVLSLILTVLQLLLKPLLRLLFLPLIFITLGLFTLVINGIVLYVLDMWSEDLTIEGLVPLALGTLIITAAHFVATILWKPIEA